jgi:hypothetical protein
MKALGISIPRFERQISQPTGPGEASGLPPNLPPSRAEADF